ncbi:hypothetical protein [Limosilactobacillus reuteri]|uniref:hypothetical protein n=1 Tax=Limosilactobacillus reuteri TaxID=1598 RepID=UPI002B05C501|nr:hypothetical protein [Limosilactobacillus reuteri]
MMNLKKNAQNANGNNQGQAMDYFAGDRDESILIKLMESARKHNINYQKVGENYLFETNFTEDVLTLMDTNEAGESVPFLDTSSYKAILVVTEEIYSEKWYAVLFTNDENKINKFKAYVHANELSDENNLKLDTKNLEGKLFPNHKSRAKLALDGMYLG